MSPEDARLVAALTVLRDQLAPVVDEIAFGELDAEDRAELARVLHTVADALEPVPMVVDPDSRAALAEQQRALAEETRRGGA